MKLNRWIGASLMLACAASLSSCQLFQDWHNLPGGADAYTIEADERLVIAKMRVSDDGLKTEDVIVLSEPSPDGFNQLATALTFDASDAGGSSIELKRDAKSALARLGHRSQGIILFRDASHRLAEARFNGVITEAEYIEKIETMANIAKELILFELDKNPTLSSDLDKVGTKGKSGKSGSKGEEKEDPSGQENGQVKD